jgi:hypothetical protein
MPHSNPMSEQLKKESIQQQYIQKIEQGHVDRLRETMRGNATGTNERGRSLSVLRLFLCFVVGRCCAKSITRVQ